MSHVANEPSSTTEPLVVGKLVPPAPPVGVVRRERLLRPFLDESRVVLIVAPAGYGKSIAAQQMVEADRRPFGWLNIDRLDDSAATFWHHFIGALRWAQPTLDDRPERVLGELGADAPAFLGALISALEGAGSAGTLVLDGVSRLSDRTILEGLALLVDRVGDVVRFVLVDRRLPELPIGRWRARGWVSELAADELCFTDDEAVAALATLGEGVLFPVDALAINRRVQGWPTGLVLGAQAAAAAAEPSLAAAQLHGADRLFAEYFEGELLDQLSPDQRQAALSLSVLRSWDVAICRELLGNETVAPVHDLDTRYGFPVQHDAATARLHPLLREMLEHTLRWLDPDLHDRLHRRAAAWYEQRGDLAAAHRHLIELGDVQAAANLLVQPVLALVNRGDRRGLADLMRLAPAATDDAPFAFDLAVAWLFVGNLAEADRWCDRGELLMSPTDAALRQRLSSTRAMVALLHGDVADAAAHVRAFEVAAHSGQATAVENRFATTAARVMLAARRLDDAAVWVDRALEIRDPAVIADVNAPALEAWLAFNRGQLDRATALAAAACARADELRARPHHGASEALVVLGWCHLAAGELTRASTMCEAARVDAEVLGVPWNRLRSGVLAAEVRRLSLAPQAAVDILRELRRDLFGDPAGESAHAVDPSSTSPTHLAAELDMAEAAALFDCGDHTGAQSMLTRLYDHPRRHLLAARLAVATGDDAAALSTLRDRRQWSPQFRVEAEVLIAAAEPWPAASERLTKALTDAAAGGWVSPFLSPGDRVATLLRKLPVQSLHPELARVLLRTAAGTSARGVATIAPDHLTPRELRLLHFLPSHLSYAEIGERLFISVNTVKTNLKALYRKLGATTRAEAVEAASVAGLLTVPDAEHEPASTLH